MRLIKLALLSFFFLFLLITAISLFIPSHIRISKATTIYAPKEEVMGYISNPEKWKSWYPGADTMDLLYIEVQPGGIVLNNKTMLGLSIMEKNDSMVIAKNIGPGAKKDFENGWKVVNGAETNGTTVQWYMDFRLRWYPWEKFSSLFYENVYGKHIELGLGNLKKLF
jgi:carbon monoxide dehydrogenase subunit G